MTAISEILISAGIKYVVGQAAKSGSSWFTRNKNKLMVALRNDAILKKYSNNCINNTFSFRTLLHNNKDVYLDEIYYPLTIESIDRRTSYEIADNTILPEHTPIVIIGIAGQGKTTILRKLFLEEINDRKRLAFFFYLRQLKNLENSKIEELILGHLIENGVCGTIEDVCYLCEKTPLALYFDGFDELNPSQRIDAIKIIKEARRKYHTKIIITSRPDSEIARESGFQIFEINKLNPTQALSLIGAQAINKEKKEHLTKIFKERKFLSATITTPLLLDLFVITSGYFKKEPTSVMDFYDELLHALIYRHERLKNFSRIRKSELCDKDLEDCFVMFSFVTFFSNESSFSHENVLSHLQKSLNILECKAIVQDVLDDIITGTNLINQDGYNNYTFIHRSIQEFFSAKYVHRMRMDSKEKFYKKLPSLTINNLDNFLFMLCGLDSYYFSNLFIINGLKSRDMFDFGKVIPLKKDEFIKCFDYYLICFDANTGRITNFSIGGPGNINKLIFLERVDSIIKDQFQDTPHQVIGQYIYTDAVDEVTKIYLSRNIDIADSIKNEYANVEFVKLTSFLDKLPQLNECMDREYYHLLQINDDIEDFITNSYTKKGREAANIDSIIELI
ncbi:NACHT domain-containing protein [Klebsiella oxytoca]|uniref:NACHT domain-containing protein n=1 Tax=Klebsiella oxytoca TaxID=571 RepID=UPI0018C719F5|nr:NACHT domain-containing protein [Klebsiella oxytoca]MBG2574311.1 NACHT domain-containing protein [Klebsiella oxytoca]HDX9152203.1 NACHT domain-containing protein [Klebsiella oxytoca]